MISENKSFRIIKPKKEKQMETLLINAIQRKYDVNYHEALLMLRQRNDYDKSLLNKMSAFINIMKDD